jgi:hypothetical protein
MTRTRTLSGILRHLEGTQAVRKADLHRGDQVLVATENSIYSIVVTEDSTYSVRGGWFDRQGSTPVRTPINGCTWGGSVIQTGLVAACGLRLEFANRVVTSPIREFLVIRAEFGEADLARLAEDDQQLLAECGISWEGEVTVC